MQHRLLLCRYIACPHNEKILTCCHSLIWLVVWVILLFICHRGNVNGGGRTATDSFLFSCPVNEALEHCRLSHLEKLWAGMNVFITHSVSLALVSSANIHKKPNIWQLFSEPSVQLCGSDVLQKSHFDFAAQPKENYLYIRGVGE